MISKYLLKAVNHAKISPRGNYNMHILESGQDYLERILMIKNKKGVVRSIDIANELNFSKPSVSIAMKKLREEHLIEVDEKGYITLTEEGYKIASGILERHVIISKMLISLGVNEKTALEDACKIEHDLSEETFQAIKNHFLNKVNK